MNRATIFLPLLLFFLTTACAAAPTPTLATPRPSASSSATPSAGPSSPTAPALATPASNRQAPMGTGDLPAPVLAFTGDPHDPRSAYALLSNYDLFYTHDRGLTWQALPFPPAGTGEDFHSIGQPYPLAGPDLVANPFQPGLLFARAGNSLYRSRDAGQTWEKLLDSLALFAVDYEGNQLYAWRPDLPREERGLYRSQDGGKTWRQTYRGYFPPALQEEVERPTTEGILSLVIDPTFGNSLIVGSHPGVFRSFSGGATWEKFNTGLPLPMDGAHRSPLLKVIGQELYLLSETRPDSGQRLVIARLAHGQIIPDQDRWEEIGQLDLSAYTSPLDPGFYGVYDLLDHQEDLYLATSGGVLASRDRGEHWQLLPGGEGATYRLGINPSSPEQLYTWTDVGLRMVAIPSETAGPPVLPTLPPVTGDASLRLLGSAGGAFNGVALTDDIAVLSAGIRLEVLDLSTTGEPRLLGRSQTLPGVPATLTALNHFVYVAIPGSGLLVFDLSDPSQPEQVSKLELPFAPRVLLSQAGQMFASGGSCPNGGCSGGLAVLDIADPARPRLLGVLKTPAQTVRVELAAGIAYLYEQACQADRCTYSLRVVNVSNPAAPGELAALEVPGPLVNLIIAGERLLLAHRSGLLVIDVSQPERPQQTGRLPFNLSSFALYDRYAYAARDWEVSILDLSDPDRPKLGGTLSSSGIEGALPLSGPIAIYHQTLYIQSTFGEFGHCSTSLHVFDLSDPAAPRQVNTAQDTLGFTCADEPAFYKDWMVLADWKGLNFVDLTQPDHPRLHGSHPLAGASGDLAVQDGYLYASNGLASDSLLVIAASEPSGLVEHGPFPFAWAWGSVPDGRYLYIPSWANGLVVADIGDPTRPKQVAGLGADQLGGYAYRVALDGDRLVVALGDAGLRILDISDAENPLPLGSLDLLVGDNYIGADWLAAHGGYIYLVTNLPKGTESAMPYLVVIDARDPLNPLQLNQLDLPAGYAPAAMHFHAGHLLLAGNRCPGGSFGCAGRFSIYDLSHPVQPVEIAALEFPFELKAMAEEDGFAYLSAAPDHLLALDLSDPSSPALAAVFPVPGCAANLSAGGQHLYLAACEAGLLILGVEKLVRSLATHGAHRLAIFG